LPPALFVCCPRYSTFDVISHEAFDLAGVRRTCFNEDFDAFLPLYINEEHFGRTLRSILPRSIEDLCPTARTGFIPVMILNVLPRLMNTMVVLLCDKGVAVCDAVIDGYTRLHRLFYACVSHFSTLRAEIQNRLKAFASSEKVRGGLRLLLAVCGAST
jgi:hypothetical protein